MLPLCKLKFQNSKTNHFMSRKWEPTWHARCVVGGCYTGIEHKASKDVDAPVSTYCNNKMPFYINLVILGGWLRTYRLAKEPPEWKLVVSSRDILWDFLTNWRGNLDMNGWNVEMLLSFKALSCLLKVDKEIELDKELSIQCLSGEKHDKFCWGILTSFS